MRDTIDMAREAGMYTAKLLLAYGNNKKALCHSELEELQQIERLVALVRADERAANIACIGRIAAMVVDPIDQARLYQAMDSIRARGNT